jgi:hypothetical protein
MCREAWEGVMIPHRRGLRTCPRSPTMPLMGACILFRVFRAVKMEVVSEVKTRQALDVVSRGMNWRDKTAGHVQTFLPSFPSSSMVRTSSMARDEGNKCQLESCVACSLYEIMCTLISGHCLRRLSISSCSGLVSRASFGQILLRSSTSLRPRSTKGISMFSVGSMLSGRRTMNFATENCDTEMVVMKCNLRVGRVGNILQTKKERVPCNAATSF